MESVHQEGKDIAREERSNHERRFQMSQGVRGPSVPGGLETNKGKMEREKQKEGGKNRRLRQRVNKKRGPKPKKEENGVET